MSKVCARCKEEKIDFAFYSRGGKNKHLLSSYCKLCYTTPEVRAKARERQKRYENGRRAYLYQKDPKYYLWYLAKKRAQKNNIPFDIEPDDIILTEYCPITGEKLDLKTNKIHTSISLDKVDNTKGYIKGNVVAISRWANLKKSDMSIEQVENLLRYMKEYST